MKNAGFLLLNLLITVNVSVAQQKSNKKVVPKKTTTKETCCTTAIPNRLVINSSNTNVENSLKITDKKTHEGMVWIAGGEFMMGANDDEGREDEYPQHRVKISGFWMDATEITNNEYRQFTNWVKDSIALKLMNHVKQGSDGIEYIDWTKQKSIKWGDKATLEKIDAIIVTPDNRIFGKKELDANKIVYQSETFDYKSAANNRDASIPRSKFIIKKVKRLIFFTIL